MFQCSGKGKYNSTELFVIQTKIDISLSKNVFLRRFLNFCGYFEANSNNKHAVVSSKTRWIQVLVVAEMFKPL